MDDFNKIVIPWIGKTAKMLDYYHTNELKSAGFDITKEQWLLLKALSLHDGASQNELACFTERDKTSMTRLVNTMEKKNLIARIPSKEDKRINLLYLTKQGEKMLSETEQIRKNVISDLQNGLSDSEIETVINVLKKIQNNIKNTNGC